MQSSSITLKNFFETKFTIWGSDKVLEMVIFSNSNQLTFLANQSDVQVISLLFWDMGELLKGNTSQLIRLGTVNDNTAYFRHPDIV